MTPGVTALFSKIFYAAQREDIASSRFMALLQDCSIGYTAQLEEFWNQEYLHFEGITG